MNCSQYSYPDNQRMNTQQMNMQQMNRSQAGTRNLTTRPITNMTNMEAGMNMPTAPSTGRMKMTGMQSPSMNLPNLGGAAAGQSNVSGGGWNMPVTTPQSLATQTPTTVESPYYTAGFLRNFIGKSMRAEFLIGTSGALVDRTGTLMEVGASYIVLKPILTDDLLMCDLYAIKFVTIYG